MAKLWGRLNSFSRDEGGNVAITFAFVTVPVLLLAGGTIDYGRTINERLKLQTAAEAAAHAGASLVEATEDERRAMARKIFLGNTVNTSLPSVSPTITVEGNRVKVEATTNIRTPFLNFASIPELAITGRADVEAGELVSNEAPGKVCLLALDPDSNDGIHLQGDNHVRYDDCWAHTNSTKPTAINAVGNNATAVGEGHCAVGGYEQSHSAFTPKPTTGCREVPDPFAVVGAYGIQSYVPKFTPPTLAVTCKASNLNLKKGTFTLDPGRYCGGINIQAGARVTFNPGVYYIDNGILNVQSGSTAVGNNVMFYLAGPNSRMQLIGGGNVDLKGRTGTSSYAGFLVIQEPNANRGGESNIQGGGTFKLQGVVYTPTQRIEVSGNGDVNNASISFFGMVAKDFYFRGNGVFNVKKHSGGTVPDIMPTMPAGGMRKTVLKE